MLEWLFYHLILSPKSHQISTSDLGTSWQDNLRSLIPDDVDTISFITSVFFLITLFQQLKLLRHIKYRFPTPPTSPRGFVETVLAAVTTRSLYHWLMVIALGYVPWPGRPGGGIEVGWEVEGFFLYGLMKVSDGLVFAAVFVLFGWYEESSSARLLVDSEAIPSDVLEDGGTAGRVGDVDLERAMESAGEVTPLISRLGGDDRDVDNASLDSPGSAAKRMIKRALLYASTLSVGAWAGLALSHFLSRGSSLDGIGNVFEAIALAISWLGLSYDLVFFPSLTVDLLVLVFLRRNRWRGLGLAESSINVIAYKLGPVLLSLGSYRNLYTWFLHGRWEQQMSPSHEVMLDFGIRGVHNVLILAFLTEITRGVLPAVVDRHVVGDESGGMPVLDPPAEEGETLVDATGV